MSGSVGDNVFRASGVIAAAAAGRTGAVDWQTDSIKTSTFTAATTEGYFCNTDGGAFTVNLPAGVAGSIVAVADYTRTFNTNNLTVSPNGSEKIGGVAEDATLSVNGQSATFVYVDGTEGWINTQETETSLTGVSPYLTATGGTITTSGDYKIHTFTGPGTFCVEAVAVCSADNNVSYVVAAGGAGGGAGVTGTHTGGAGGGGGYREGKGTSDCYTASPLNAPTGITVTATGFPITVGGGGAGSENSNARGTPGVDSVFSSITSTGGGGGGSPQNAPNYPGVAGGSGGGGASEGNGPGGAGNTPPVSPSQGFGGGQGTNAPPDVRSGGGGGATELGSSGTPSPIVAGRGGAGATTCVTGSPVGYSGGGGGGGNPNKSNTAGAGSPCGSGGAGGCTSGQAGLNGSTNKGGGGGGGKGGPPSGTPGGTGGSGVVILRYQYQ